MERLRLDFDLTTGFFFPTTANTEVPVIVVVVVVVVVVDTTAIVGTTVVDTMAGAIVVYTTELGRVLDGVLRGVVVAERLDVVIGVLTHVSRAWEEEEEEGGKKVPDELTDFAACPGRGRVVGEPTKDEVSAPGACPGRGRGVRHSVFKGEGRGGNDKSSESAACPSRGRDIGRDVRFETCVKGLDVVETELGVATRAELDMAFAELDSL